MKEQFFTQYWGQYYKLKSTNQRFVVNERVFPLSEDKDECLILKCLSSITDEEIKEVCKMAHNLLDVDGFKIYRKKDDIHCSWIAKIISAEHHICLNYKYATINANLHFSKTDTDESSSHKVNISEIQYSSKRVVGYIQILDYLRLKGYALPYLRHSVEDLVKLGWIEIN